jgi:hypothetical protein
MSNTIRFLGLSAAMVLAGCGPPTLKPSKPTERAGGLISQIHDKVDETVNMIELDDLYKAIAADELSGQMPTQQAIRDWLKKNNPKLSKLIEDGTIILEFGKSREGVWAYEKNAPTKGGWVITHAGPSKMTPEELKRQLGQGN